MKWPERKTRFVIYDRHSSTDQDETTAEHRQRACLEEGVRRELVPARPSDHYADYAETGRETLNRRRYQQLLADARSPECDFGVIVVFHSSRWGRGLESEFHQYQLEKVGFSFIWVTQPGTEGSSVAAVASRGILQLMDRLASVTLSEQTRHAQSSNARDGFWNGGRIPDGYSKNLHPTGVRNKRGKERVKVRLTLNEEPGPFDRIREPRWKCWHLASQLALDRGAGDKAIARELTRRGWRQLTQDLPMGPSHVRAVLKNPVYTGHISWGRKNWYRDQGRRLYREVPPSEWVWSQKPPHPPIFSKDAFDRHLKRYGTMPSDFRDCGSLLAGLLICSACGSHYAITGNRKKGERHYRYFICSKKHRLGWRECPSRPIGVEPMVQAITEILFLRVVSEAELEIYALQVAAWAGAEEFQREKRLAERRHELKVVQTEIDGLLRTAKGAEPGMEPRALVHALRECELRKAALEMEVQANGGAQQPRAAIPDRQGFVELRDWLREKFHLLDAEAKRAFLRQFIRRVEIHPDKTARIVFDPSQLAFGPIHEKDPALDTFRLKERCGGGI